MNKLLTQFVHFDDCSIAYTENGMGDNLILLHGNSADKKTFLRYQTELFSDFHSYAIDSRGHGESKSKDTEFSIEQYSIDVINFCKEKGIRKANVIGYSDGGNIALHLVHKEPEMFHKIICVSPNYLVSGLSDSFLQLLKIIVSVLTFMKNIRINTTKRLKVYDLMLKDIGLSETELKSIKTKVFILYAEKELVKEEHIQNIHKSIAESLLLKIEGCSHFNIIKNKNTIEIIRNYME